MIADLVLLRMENNRGDWKRKIGMYNNIKFGFQVCNFYSGT
jgi:hypothetical protein